MRLHPSHASVALRGATLATLGLLALLLAGPAAAVDGVIEINDTRAIAGGVTGADLPGYPVEIAGTDSFVLTGNLTPPVGVSGIQLLPGAQDVTIDLNGFSIVGAAGAAGYGIDGSGIDGVVVTNGTVRGFGFSGIIANSYCRIERVQLAGNAGDGLTVTSDCLVIKNIIQNNTQHGAQCTNNGCKFENNIVRSNGLTGLFALVEGIFIANEVIANGDGGIWSDVAGNIRHNVIAENSSFGIRGFGPGNVIEHNSVRDTVAGPGGPGMGMELPADNHKINDNVVGGSADAGILCGPACTINNNTVSFNGTAQPSGPTGLPGIICIDACTLNQNTVSFNSGDGINLAEPSSVNHSTVSNNGDDGIECTTPGPVPCTVNGCLVHGNGTAAVNGFGLNYSGGAVGPGGYRNNVFWANGLGDVIPLLLDPAFQNVCTGVVPCP